MAAILVTFLWFYVIIPSFPARANKHAQTLFSPVGTSMKPVTILMLASEQAHRASHAREWRRAKRSGGVESAEEISHLAAQVSISFSCVCPVIDHEFRHNIVKVAVDPRGDSGVDPQTTLTML